MLPIVLRYQCVYIYICIYPPTPADNRGSASEKKGCDTRSKNKSKSADPACNRGSASEEKLVAARGKKT